MGRVLLQHVLPDWSPRHSIRSCLLACVTINGSILGRGNKSGRGGVVFLEQICSRLVQAQSMMKLQPEKHHRTLELTVGDWAWLCLNHRTVVSICDVGHSKLAPKLFGPYQVVEHIGPIVYQLKLSPRARVHNVFHAEFLQKYEGLAPPSVPPLPPIVRGKVVPQPDQVLCAQPTSSSNIC
jgi:hypothetical protein